MATSTLPARVEGEDARPSAANLPPAPSGGPNAQEKTAASADVCTRSPQRDAYPPVPAATPKRPKPLTLENPKSSLGRKAQHFFDVLKRAYDKDQCRPALILLLDEFAFLKARLMEQRMLPPDILPSVEALESAAFELARDNPEEMERLGEAARALREFVAAHDNDKCHRAGTAELRRLGKDIRSFEEAKGIEIRQQFILNVVQVVREVSQDGSVARHEIATQIAKRLAIS